VDVVTSIAEYYTIPVKNAVGRTHTNNPRLNDAAVDVIAASLR
jgi:hypothetical protein